jgi:hypothetical protein
MAKTAVKNIVQKETIQTPQKKQSKKNLATASILIVVLLLCFFRIPYTGDYIDSYIFDFFFGTYKYIIYIYLFSLLVV